MHCEEVTFVVDNGASQPVSRIAVEMDPMVVLFGVQSGERPLSLVRETPPDGCRRPKGMSSLRPRPAARSCDCAPPW